MTVEKKILHLDMDAFFAAVEQVDRPEYRGLPVIVGGPIGRGVVSACSYEARVFGVRSAMAMARAVSLCPNAAVLPVRMARYREVSKRIFQIFSRYTDCIEPLSIDEAFLDVTDCQRLFGPPATIAAQIRAAVRVETGLVVSAGIAPNKFLAKLASEGGKPDGLLEITPQEIENFLLPLPLERIWGIGRVTAERLASQGLHTVRQLREVPLDRLISWFGSQGAQLYRLARGQDERPVTGSSEVKSVGHEETFSRDLWDQQALRLELLDLAERVAGRLRAKGLVGRGVSVKVRFADFSTVTRSRTLAEGTAHSGEIYRQGEALLTKTEAGRRAVRLLGLSVTQLAPEAAAQGELFAEKEHRLADLDRAIDRLRERYGDGGIRRGSLLEKQEGTSSDKKRSNPGKGS